MIHLFLQSEPQIQDSKLRKVISNEHFAVTTGQQKYKKKNMLKIAY